MHENVRKKNSNNRLYDFNRNDSFDSLTIAQLVKNTSDRKQSKIKFNNNPRSICKH